MTMVIDRVKRGNGGPVAIETRVGWVLSGPIHFPSPSADVKETSVYRFDTISKQSNLEVDLMQLWELESILESLHPFQNGGYPAMAV